jgi:cysteine desulfurase
MIYLDNSASTAVDPAVLEAMTPWMTGQFANPSSMHGPGVAAASALEEAAARVAPLAGPGPWDVVFTSGGTEGNALAVLGSVTGGRRRRVVTSAIEHPSVLRNAARLEDRGVEVIRIGPGPDGTIDAAGLASAVDARTVLVSLMHGNNEIGTLQPVREAAARARASSPGVTIHVDAVQTAGKVDLAAVLEQVDLVTLSAHKIHGPKGVGALLVRRSSRRPAPLFLGGDQQHGLRPGTENVPGIVGFGVASVLALERVPGLAARMAPLEAAFLDALGGACEPAFAASPRVPGHLALRIRGVPAGPVVHAMEARGVVVSSGSACHSRSPRRSHVLEALSLPPDEDVIRVVASHETTQDEMRAAGSALRSVLDGMGP